MVEAGVSLHFNRGTNMIDWVMRSPEDIYHATSFELDNMGASASAVINCDEWLGRKQPLRRLTVAYA